MKITEITIQLIPSENELCNSVILRRKADKTWSVWDDQLERGLRPGEIKLAQMIQDLISIYKGD